MQPLIVIALYGLPVICVCCGVSITSQLPVSEAPVCLVHTMLDQVVAKDGIPLESLIASSFTALYEEIGCQHQV